MPSASADCHELVPEFRKAANALEGVAKFGAVNCDDNSNVCNNLRIQGYPAVKFFQLSKGIDAESYTGEHDANAIVQYVQGMLNPATVKLSAKNWEEKVLKSTDLWIVDFTAGAWCGPCTQLKTTLRDVAHELKGIARVGLVDCEGTGSALCEQYNIESYPAVFAFPRGPKARGSGGPIKLEVPDSNNGFGGGGPGYDLQIASLVIKAALGWRECFDETAFRTAIEGFYENHVDPEQGGKEKVDAAIAKWRGNEREMVSKLEAKYGEKVGFAFDKSGSTEAASAADREDL
jgi:thiol-disulfide isomerase/thioredoxin